MNQKNSQILCSFQQKGNYLAASVPIPFSATARTRIEDIKEKGIGPAINTVRQYANSKDPNKPYKFTKSEIYSVNGYALSVLPFSYGNNQVDWTIVLFFDEFTIYAFTYIYTLVTVLFMTSILFLGFLATCGFSCCFIFPFLKIQKAFRRIAALGLFSCILF